MSAWLCLGIVVLASIAYLAWELRRAPVNPPWACPRENGGKE